MWSMAHTIQHQTNPPLGEQLVANPLGRDLHSSNSLKPPLGSARERGGCLKQFALLLAVTANYTLISPKYMFLSLEQEAMMGCCG